MLALLSGCSLLGDGPKWGAKRDAAESRERGAGASRAGAHASLRDRRRPPTSSASCRRRAPRKEDTLTDIARRFNVGYEEIVRANPGVDPWLPGENREIVIPSQFILPNAPREGIVINAAAMRLFYYPKVKKGEQQVVHTYPIGIGKVGWKTPEGATTIVRRHEGSDLAADGVDHQGTSRRARRGARAAWSRPGPDNPLGRFAFYLGWPTYMIHGTNKPAGVGLRSSHGCIRLYPEDIARAVRDGARSARRCAS